MKSLWLIILLLIPQFVFASKPQHGIAVFSELKYPENFTHFDYVNPEAPKGGKASLASVGAFDSLNLHTLKGNKAPGLENTYDTLLVSSSDELNSYYGLLAKSFEISDDGLSVVFNLHPNARWHDGDPITAEDVAFSLEILRQKGSPSYKIMLQDVKSAEVISPTQVKYYFSNNKDPLIVAAVGQLPVLKKSYFSIHDFEKTDGVFPSSGPYKIKTFEANKYISYERVKDYWAKDLPVHKGVYNFDEIEYKLYLEHIIAIEALKAGEIDYREENVSKLWAKAYQGKAFSEGKIIRETVSHSLPPNLQAMFLNLRKPYLNDRALRMALTYAYDFDWINLNLLYSLYSRIGSYYQSTPYASSGLPNAEELKILNRYRDALPQEVFTTEFKVPSTMAEANLNRQNIRYAKQILEDAGYKFVAGKLISPITNAPVKLEVIYHFQGFERLLLAYKDNLAKLGIELNLKLIDYSQYFRRMQKFDYDVIIAAFAPITLPGRLENQLWHSDADVEGGFNLSGVHNKAVDEIINRMDSVTTQVELEVLSKSLDRVLLWEFYAVPQLYSNKFRLIYWNKFGIPEIRPQYAIGFETWWIKN